MKQRFSKLLPVAIDAIREGFGVEEGNGSWVVREKIPREYQGYISSFGASVLQMGLLPTMAHFSSQKENGGAVQNKSDLLTILRKVVISEKCGMDGELKKQIMQTVTRGQEAHSLFVATLNIARNEDQLQELQSHLMDAAVATKLAIRTFKLSNDG